MSPVSSSAPPDTRLRCGWAPAGDELYLEYHDREWGVPSHDDRHLYEMLVLEGAQAGLSWATILHKREGYRRAFQGFEPAVVARFGDRDVERLLADSGIVRNRLKVESAVSNARCVLEVQEADRELCRVSLELRRRRADRRLLAHARRASGGDRRVTRDEQGPQAARVPLRRPDRLLLADAVDGHGAGPRRRLLPVRRDQPNVKA